jgi:hypothetical protein
MFTMVDNRSIKVKVLKETSKTVTIRMTTLNRKMPVPRKEFEKRVEDGLYEVIGGYDADDEEEK